MNVQFAFVCWPFLFPGLLLGQVFVDPNNNVGVGTSSPDAKFEVYATPANGNGVIFQTHNTSSTTTKGLSTMVGQFGTGSRYGIYNRVYTPTSGNTGKTYGTYSMVYSTDVEGYGLYNVITQASSAITKDVYGIYNEVKSYGYGGAAYGEFTYLGNTTPNNQSRYGNYIVVSNGQGPQYGVYSACHGSQSFAGWFSGDVWVTGDFVQTSDARIKQNVRAIDGALGTIRQLSPRAYEFRQDMGLGLPDGKNFGFIAQDLEKVLPELVKEGLAPVDPAAKAGAGKSEEATERDGEDPQSPPTPELIPLKSVNYTQLIPILTQAVQELADQVDAQAATIAAQAQTIEALRTEIRNR